MTGRSFINIALPVSRTHSIVPSLRSLRASQLLGAKRIHGQDGPSFVHHEIHGWVVLENRLPSLLAIPQGFHCPPSFFDVAGGAIPLHDCSLLVSQRRHPEHEPPMFPVGTPNTHFIFKRLPGR